MITLFYLALVFFSGEVTFSFIWLIIAIVIDLFIQKDKIYRYTDDPTLDGQEVTE